VNIVVTAGGTSENIDGVRKITNTSTGTTGRNIAAKLLERKHNIVFLHAANVQPIIGATNINFESFDNLEQEFTDALKKEPDWLIHAAAVSDYKLESVFVDGKLLSAGEKIDSGKKLRLELTPTPKLVQKVKNLSPDTKLFAFKFTNTSSDEKRLAQVNKLFDTSGAEFVLHNDASEKTDQHHVFTIFDSKRNKIKNGEKAEQLTDSVVSCIEENL
jgi:phosphopantothenoylcysteine decarboxylase/phosphopantothenate--cysteine ligase